MTLKDFLGKYEHIAIAFSGGVDSSYLLCCAMRYCDDVTAYYAQTPFQPRFERTDAERVAKFLGAKLKIIEYNILNDDVIAANTPQRCYFCKRKMFGLICAQAQKDGYETVADGTNASDKFSERPGMKALAENGILSPLRECGITKDYVRTMSKDEKLFTWDKPAYSCLATRIPHGTRIDEQTLFRIEMAENEIHALGFSDFRVRLSEGAPRFQIKEGEFTAAAKYKNELSAIFKRYFNAAYLNPEVR